MFAYIAKKIFGTANDREIKNYQKVVEKINQKEVELEKKTDEDLANLFRTLREQHESLDDEDIKIESFSLVREASRRTIGLRHFDTQIIGGLALVEGNIAEMGTGEGKTLVSTLACSYQVAISKNVHVVTVNEYLAKRDSTEMSGIFNFLGMTVGCNTSDLSTEEKAEQYGMDIVYGTNSEFGFDYLRDNLAKDSESQIQGVLDYCLIDEVDSILIDEARTPLVISGPIEDTQDMYRVVADICSVLTDDDIDLSEKDKQAQLNDAGHEKIEAKLIESGMLENKGDLYNSQGLIVMHYVNATIKALFIMKKDVDYMIRDDQVMIIDEFTGRAMEGRRWSNGIHQALEQKEGVEVQPENETVASVTYQNYFRMYDVLSGMTGTADTEAVEFEDIYGLNVVCVPPNKPSMRKDQNDRMYSSMEYKMDAIIQDIRESNERGQPVLVGTPSVEVSEDISMSLSKAGIKHEVLNAKNHSREAEIIENAGSLSAVTIATNMAGRGTDIKLGGTTGKKTEVENVGGLRVIGVERQDNRRLDNQLIGRSGRQGDVGSSCFYVSPDDNLLRLFGGESIKSMMERLNAGNEVIEHSFLNKAVTNAQKKIEGSNYDARKNIIKYDDIANTQREIVYEVRNKIIALNNENTDRYIFGIAHSTIDIIVGRNKGYSHYPEAEEEKDLVEAVSQDLGYSVEYSDNYTNDLLDIFKGIVGTLNDAAPDMALSYKKDILLHFLDAEWTNHLRLNDELKGSVNLRGYAQKDPIKEFQSESFDSFSTMLDEFKVKFTKFSIKSIGTEIDRMTNQSNNGWLVSDNILNNSTK